MRKLEKLTWYADFATDLYENPSNVEQRLLWSRIDNMDECAVTIPPALLDQPWVSPEAKFAVTLGHDIIAAVTRFLASNEVRIDGVLTTPDPDDKKRMDGMEIVMRYQYSKMNQRGELPAVVEMTKSATKYCAIALRTMNTKYEAKRKVSKKQEGGRAKKEFLYSDAERKEMTYCGDWNWPVRNVHNIYPTWTKNKTLVSVVEIGVCSLYDIVNEYGDDNPGVAKALDGLDLKVYENSELRAQNVSKFDYMDSEFRAMGFCLSGGESWSLEGQKYELLRQEHKIGFLPYVIVDFKEPLLKGIADSGLYGRLAELRAIMASEALGSVAKTDDYVISQTPENTRIIESNDPNEPDILPTGTTKGRLPRKQPNPQILLIYQELKGEFVSSAAARALLEVESMLGRAQVGTLNAAQNTARAQLGLVEQAIILAHERAVHQMLRWNYETDEPSMGYETSKGGDTPMTAPGASFMLRGSKSGAEPGGPNDIVFDPQNIQIKATLQPAYIQDEQAKYNTAIVMRNAGVSERIALEKQGIDVDLNTFYKMDEAMEVAVLNARVQKILGEAQLKLEMAGMQMQQQMAQGQPGKPPTQETQTRDRNGAAQFAGTKGLDTRTGGTSPAEVVPGENRNTLNGTDDTGAPLA